MDGTTVFARNLSALIKDRGLKQSAVAAVAGVSEATVSNWLNRGTAPHFNTSKRICDYYGIPVDALISEQGGYASAKPLGAMEPAEPRRAYAPLYGRVHAGTAGEPDILEGKVPVPYEVLANHPRGFFLEVEGDCMDLTYPEGCHVFVDPEIPPKSRSACVCSVDGEYLIRRLTIGADMLMLSPESRNKKWRDIVVSSDDPKTVQLIGTVVWFQASRESK